MRSALSRWAGLRRFSAAAVEEESRTGDTLNRWLQEWTAVPRVVVPPGTEPPTALSWLRRRGPPLPEGTLHKLFRSKTVRLWDPATQRVSRASKASPLPAGALLLLPKSELAAAAPAAGEAGGTPQRPPSPAQQRQRAEAAAALRGALLHSGPDFLAVCKPAGLATQGGRGVAASVDGVMAEAFRGLPGLGRPQDLRLVHRLDRQTTGVLLIAKSPDAAAWLSAAFRDGSSSGKDGSRGKSSSPCSISKTYWAVVARAGKAGSGSGGSGSSSSSGRGSSSGSSGTWLPPAGTISLPVPSSRDPGTLQEALTRYRVLQQSASLAWLELQPATGRKHQLRLHCAQGLGAPVLGDSRYGTWRSPQQGAALAALQHSDSSELPLFLHCRSMVVRQPGTKRGSTEITAPLPLSWRALLVQVGWPLPADSPP